MDAELKESYEIVCKKYKKLKDEMMNILWQILPEKDQDFNGIPNKITQEQNYVLKERVGEGQYGIVYKSYKNGKVMAAKVINKRACLSYASMKRLSSELDILRNINHDSIIKLYETVSHPDKLVILTERSFAHCCGR